VHDKLGERVGYFLRNKEELEEMANARVLDEFTFCRDANTYRMEQGRLAINQYGGHSFPNGAQKD